MVSKPFSRGMLMSISTTTRLSPTFSDTGGTKAPPRNASPLLNSMTSLNSECLARRRRVM